MTVLRWLKDHWYVPLVVLAAALGWFVGVRNRGPSETLDVELEAIDAGKTARLDAIDRGEAAAIKRLDAEYRDTLERLDARQKGKADALLRDPARRARWLHKLSRSG